jgi:hypothetical protein
VGHPGVGDRGEPDPAGAEGLLAESLTLVHRLPGTLAALEAGLLHRGHLWHLLDKVAPIEDAGLRAEIEATCWPGWRGGTG